MRRIKELVELEKEFCDKVWYNRCMNRIFKMQQELKLWENTSKEIEQAQWYAQKTKDRYPNDQMEWDDFERGMLNGKLSAIRRMLWDERDMLDT